HVTEIIPFNSDADFVPALHAIASAETPPELVGISLAFQWRARDFLALAVALRDAGYRGHITLGGHFATFESREVLTDFPEVDSVCRQESEDTMVALVDAVAGGSSDLTSIPGLSLRAADGDVFTTGHPPLPDLATLPWPDRRGAAASCFGHGI